MRAYLAAIPLRIDPGMLNTAFDAFVTTKPKGTGPGCETAGPLSCWLRRERPSGRVIWPFAPLGRRVPQRICTNVPAGDAAKVTTPMAASVCNARWALDFDKPSFARGSGVEPSSCPSALCVWHCLGKRSDSLRAEFRGCHCLTRWCCSKHALFSILKDGFNSRRDRQSFQAIMSLLDARLSRRSQLGPSKQAGLQSQFRVRRRSFNALLKREAVRLKRPRWKSSGCRRPSKNVRFGSEADIGRVAANVCFGPKADIERGDPYVCFGPEADIERVATHVSFGPLGDIGRPIETAKSPAAETRAPGLRLSGFGSALATNPHSGVTALRSG